MGRPLMRCVIGPTAVGKTEVAIAWARANNAEILCADAPLVFAGMDIGTAKPTAEEQKQVRHHGLDWVTVQQSFSVADYVTRAQEVVKDVTARGKKLVVVGGSGFYLKSFWEAVTDGTQITEEIVAHTESLAAREGLAGLLKELVEVGGSDLEGLDVKNPRRVIKALQRCLAHEGKKSFQELRREFLDRPVPYADWDKRCVMLLREKGDLEARIASRAKKMIEAGLIDEVRQLAEVGLERNPQAASVIGYRETLRYIKGELTKDELIADIVGNTLQLARKQRVFFRQLPVDEAVLLAPGEKASPKMID